MVMALSGILAHPGTAHTLDAKSMSGMVFGTANPE